MYKGFSNKKFLTKFGNKVSYFSAVSVKKKRLLNRNVNLTALSSKHLQAVL